MHTEKIGKTMAKRHRCFRRVRADVHRTPFCFASFGVQEISKKVIKNQTQILSKPPPGASGGTLGPPLGPIWAPSEKRVEKKRRKAPKLQPLFELFSALLPKR